MADLLGKDEGGRKKAHDNGSRLSPNWEPNSAEIAFAVEWGCDWERIRDEFRDYWVSKTRDATKLDWSATWRNWVRRAGKKPAQPSPPADLLTRPKGGRTLQAIHKSFAEAWHAITNDVLKELADDIDMAAAALEEGDRAHFRCLVAAEVQNLSSALAQAVAQGRERPPFPYSAIDWQRLADRTESQMHSTDGFEGRKNLAWWQRRYPERYGKPAAPEVVDLAPARELWANPNR